MIRVGGRQRWITTGITSQREAEREERRLLAERDANRFRTSSAATVADYLAWWMDHVGELMLAPQTLAVYRSALRWWEARIGAIRLDQLRRTDVQAAVAALAECRAPGTVRRYVAHLSAVLARAVADELIPANPAARLALPKRQPSGKRSYTAAEARALMAAARERREILAVLAFGLGLRDGEGRALRWADVDWGRNAAAIQRSRQRSGEYKSTKSGRARWVPMPGFVRETLADERARQELCRKQERGWNPDDLVVVGTDGRALRSHTATIMDRLCRAAGVPRLTMHELRHTHATLLLDDGEDLKTVSEQLGHADVAITMRVYQHVLDGARGRTAGRMDRLMGSEEG